MSIYRTYYDVKCDKKSWYLEYPSKKANITFYFEGIKCEYDVDISDISEVTSIVREIKLDVILKGNGSV